MPLYEYQCPKCGVFELIRKFSDEPLTACPTCGCEVQKLASAPAIQFKGTGWYITDYARKSSGDGKSGQGKSGEAQSGDSKSGEGKSGEGKSDSKSGDSGKGTSGDSAKSAKDASSATSATTSKGGSASGSGSSK